MLSEINNIKGDNEYLHYTKQQTPARQYTLSIIKIMNSMIKKNGVWCNIFYIVSVNRYNYTLQS